MSNVPSEEIEFEDVDGTTRIYIYLFHPHHRNNHPKKSQWTIATPSELDSFVGSLENSWLEATQGWGVHLSRGYAYLMLVLDEADWDEDKVVSFIESITVEKQ